MKQYKKTVWVDGQTPVNASNLNKIETALSEISKLSLSPSDLGSLDEKEIRVTSDCGKIMFGIGENIPRTTSLSSIDIINSNETKSKEEKIAFIISGDDIDLMTPGSYQFTRNGVIYFPIGHEAFIMRENGSSVGQSLNILENLSVKSGSLRNINIAFEDDQESLNNLPEDGLVYIFGNISNNDLDPGFSREKRVNLEVSGVRCYPETLGKLVVASDGNTVEDLLNKVNNLENEVNILREELTKALKVIDKINPECLRRSGKILWIITNEEDNSEYQVEEILVEGDNINIYSEEGFSFTWDSEIPEVMPDYDITITGKRIRNQYKVTFKIDEEIISEEILPFGSEIVYPEVEEKIGYTFSGWGDNTALVVPAEDLIYNGTYAINKYTVTYWANSIDIDAENGDHLNVVEYNYGDEIKSFEAEIQVGEDLVIVTSWMDIDGIQYDTVPAMNLNLIPKIDVE